MTNYSGRLTNLRHVEPRDYPFLFQLLTGPTGQLGWRHRGETPQYERFVQGLFQDVFAQFVVYLAGDDLPASTPTGYVAGYNLNLRAGHAYATLVFGDAHQRSLVPIDATVILLRFLFEQWPLRKVYFERPAYVGRLAAIKRYCEEEGTLTDYAFFDGRTWDVSILSVSRDAMHELTRRYWGADS
jgi:hypothetical protein